jgi:hypothetical protein
MYRCQKVFVAATVIVSATLFSGSLLAQVIAQRVPPGTVLTPLPAPLPATTSRTRLQIPVGPAPQNVRMLPGGPLVHTLVWDRLPGIDGYNVLVNNTATKGTWVLATPTPLLAETYADTNFPQPGAQYRVIALYPDGRQGATDFVYANPPQLQVPTGFTAQQTGPGKVRLSWQPVALAKGYRLYGSGQPADGTFITGTEHSFNNMPDGNYSWRLTADYGGAWQGAGMPVANITLTTAASGHYLVTITGVRAVQESKDDMLSRDGMGDEIYVTAFTRKYDRRTENVMAFWPSRTGFTYGDIKDRGTSRIQAGTRSPTGGIRSGDPVPANSDPAERNANPSDIAFPLKIFDGTLTNGVDALVISPAIWEEDNGNLAYVAWSTQMNQITPLLYKRPEIQSQVGKGTFEPILFGTSAVPGMTDAAWAAMLVTVAAPLAMPTMGLSFLPVVGDRIINGDADRPIGLIPSGIADVGFVFPNRMVVLTREIIEAALAPPSTMPALVGPPLWPRLPKPGVMMIPFHDGAYPNDFKSLWRPAYYEMYLKVERLP